MNKIIVQAGGKGSRLEKHTFNKPKALVSVNGKPILFHLFDKFPDSEFIIISDYKHEVFKRYLKKYAKVKFNIIKTNESGTCSGIEDSLFFIEEDEPFVLIWSDLILSDIELPKEVSTNFIGISQDFNCRWSYIEKSLIETPSINQGVAGFFIFKNKYELNLVPRSGEFVRWLKEKRKSFVEIPLFSTKEFGLRKEYEDNEIKNKKSRPFNRVIFTDTIVEKVPLDKTGIDLAKKEKNWYNFVIRNNYSNIPKVYSFDPFQIERLESISLVDNNISYENKSTILKNIVKAIKDLHSLVEEERVDERSVYKNYIEKTYERVLIVQDLIPFIENEFIKINGKKCRNIFKSFDLIKLNYKDFIPNKFNLIHGDTTFSNVIIDNNFNTFLIDPRGYFGETSLFGDVDYDWAKLYYSIKGNYDQFNSNNFELKILDNEVELSIDSSGWEEMEDLFFDLIGQDKKMKILFLHFLIWLSLTSYTSDNYDAICGAFYKGIYEYERYFSESNK
jgi:GTP:adenosylcobinamide-phosphate guanylyltransferase/thiamine kinase-like enzyme